MQLGVFQHFLAQSGSCFEIAAVALGNVKREQERSLPRQALERVDQFAQHFDGAGRIAVAPQLTLFGFQPQDARLQIFTGSRRLSLRNHRSGEQGTEQRDDKKRFHGIGRQGLAVGARYRPISACTSARPGCLRWRASRKGSSSSGCWRSRSSPIIASSGRMSSASAAATHFS